MKKNYYNLLFSLVGLLMFSTAGMAQTYVDQDASGAGDGSSWADAYTNLNAALSSTASGEIWVADGTYLPNETVLDSSATFRISSNIALYGGFNGTETNLGDRDPSANGTILSGDMGGDDVADDFVNNKTDNVQHVIVVDSLLSSVTIDGFTISGGYTSFLFNPDTGFFGSGGGIYSLSTINLKNCTLSQNYGRTGGGLYISGFTGGGSGSVIEDCVFTNNITTANAAAIFIVGIADVNIINTQFLNNTTVRGAFYPIFCLNVNVEGCTFDNNVNADPNSFGGAVFNWQTTGLNFSNSTFSNNSGGNGGVLYNDARDIEPGVISFRMNNCTFTNNVASGFGGGVGYIWMSSYEVENCTFNTSAGLNGAALYNSGSGDNVLIKDCLFEEGAGDFGGAVNCYGDNTTYNVVGSTFQNNMAGTTAGSLIAGFGGILRVDSSDFINNMANFGGVFYLQNTADVEITNTNFTGNTSSNSGGVMGVFADGSILFDNCNFLSNGSGVGGALSIAESTDTIAPLAFTVSNSIFDLNTASSQGAAINTFNVNSNIFNNVFTRSFNTSDEGAGGAISINATLDSTLRTVNIINNTIVNNTAPIGAGIGAFTTEDFGAEVVINMQNNILSNPIGSDLEVEGGTPSFVSLGGNIGSDDSTTDILTDATDQNGVTDVMFTNADLADFHLELGSPAIDAGIATGAPEFDLEGNPRVGAIDVGAYEFQGVVGTENLEVNNGQLAVYPNPVGQLLNFELKGEWNNNLEVNIFNIKGQLVRTWNTVKSSEILQETVNVNNIAKGVYDIVISDGNKVIVERFVKM